MTYCPQCGNDDIVGGKLHGPRDANGDRVTLYEYYCGACGLMESCAENEPRFGDFYRRWHQRDELDPPLGSGE